MKNNKTMTKQEFIKNYIDPIYEGRSYAEHLEVLNSFDLIIEQAISDHEAGKNVIKAKAIKRKGTDKWYRFNEDKTMSTSSVPDCWGNDWTLTEMKQEYDLPADAELIDIEIIIPAPFQEGERYSMDEIHDELIQRTAIPSNMLGKPQEGGEG